MTTEPIPPQGDEDIVAPTEEVHLPGPSYLPVWTAFGLTIGLVGILLSWVIAIIGALVALYCIVRWVRETRQDISDLPLEH
jgi:H+/gluconate symporter-like permease